MTTPRISHSHRSSWWTRQGRFGVSHALLTAVAISMLIPFAWMLLTSFKSIDEVESAAPLPTTWHPENYKGVFQVPRVAFGRYYFNSLFVACWVTFLQTLTSSMAAYAFARLRWPGRDTVFKLYLGTLMIPGVVTMIPNYALMVRLHLLDSYMGLIVPAALDRKSVV